MNYKNYKTTLSYEAGSAFAQVVQWFTSQPRKEVRVKITQAITAYYYPQAVMTRDAIVTARRALEQRLFDLIELERSLSQSPEPQGPLDLNDFGLDDDSLVRSGTNNVDNF